MAYRMTVEMAGEPIFFHDFEVHKREDFARGVATGIDTFHRQIAGVSLTEEQVRLKFDVA